MEGVVLRETCGKVKDAGEEAEQRLVSAKAYLQGVLEYKRYHRAGPREARPSYPCVRQSLAVVDSEVGARTV